MSEIKRIGVLPALELMTGLASAGEEIGLAMKYPKYFRY